MTVRHGADIEVGRAVRRRVADVPDPQDDVLASLLDALGRGAATAKAMVGLASGIESKAWNPRTLRDLAKIGSSGNAKNAERDLHRWVRRQTWGHMLPEPFEFKLLVTGHAGIGAKEVDHAVLLPHEVFGSIFAFAPELFERLFTGGAANLEEYWRRSADTAWYRAHPVVKSTPDPRQRVPIGLHGDDVGTHGSGKLLVLTWGSVAVRLKTLDTRIVFCNVNTKDLIADVTLNAILAVLTWSVNTLSTGEYPSEDHNGKAFSASHHPSRFKLAGRPLAGGMVGAWSEQRGDWSYLKLAYGLVNFWASACCCHLCMAGKAAEAGMHLFTDFRRAAPLRHTRVTHEEHMASIDKQYPSPLYSLIGFHIWRVWVDVMHTLDLGILQYAIPSALWEIGSERKGRWAGATRRMRLYKAHAEYAAWIKARNLGFPARRFEESKMHKQGLYPSWSLRNAKAAQIRTMQHWVAEVCAEEAAARPENEHALVRATMFASFSKLDWACRDAGGGGCGRFPSSVEAETIAQLAEDALVAHNWLSSEAIDAAKRLWKMVPKFHMLTHSCFDMAPEANPRAVHCYPDEDMVGKVKKIATACHGATAPHRSLQRYIIVVALRWLRELAQMRGFVPGYV